MENVAIIGASPKPERYSHKAQALLAQHGHRVFPVSPRGGEVLGVAVATSLDEVEEPIDTVTMYVAPEHQPPIVPALLAKQPRRVIFNPGTESAESIEKLEAAGIKCVQACTLVMLNTGQYDDAD